MTLTDLLIIAGFILQTGITVGLFYGHIKECALFRTMIRQDIKDIRDLVLNKYGF